MDGSRANMTAAELFIEEILLRPAWHAQAACREHPDLDWFPERGDTVGDAVAVCVSCPVITECRQWAVAQWPNLKGIWGGLSSAQRSAARAA